MIVEDIRGAGTLITSVGEFPVTYGLTRDERGGHGQIIGDEEALSAAFDDDKCHLNLGDRRIAPIIVTLHPAGAGLAEYKLCGAIVEATKAGFSEERHV